jgi:hypothetical protein
MWGELTAYIANAYANAVDAASSAVSAAASSSSASDSASSASANAVAAAASAGASVWVSGTTYALGDARYSPINVQVYRRIVAGAGTTDPSLDATNWREAIPQSPAGNILLFQNFGGL